MERRLRAPATANFPWGHVANVRELGSDRWQLRSYVDAENAFGANVRTAFSCTVELQSGGRYAVVDFTVIP